ASCAATAAADPPDDPPGTSGVLAPRRRHGDWTGPKEDVSLDEPMANSSLLVLPSMTAPSRHSCAVTVGSEGGTKLSRLWLASVGRAPAVQTMSFPAMGPPSSGRASPRAIRSSAALAIARARAGVSNT